MTADILCFCEKAEIRQPAGFLTIHNALSAVKAVCFPFSAEIDLAWRIRFSYDEEGPHQISVRISSERNEEVMLREFNYIAKMEEISLNTYAVGRISGFTFPRAELYTATISCDREPLQLTHVRVLV